MRWFTLVLSLAVFGCGVKEKPARESDPTGRAPPTARAVSDKSVREKEKPPIEAPTVIEAEPLKAITLGEIELTVRVQVGGFQDEGYNMHEPKMLVVLTLKNLNPAKIADVWTQHSSATVTDDLGNQYLEHTAKNQFGSPLFVMGQTVSWGKPSRLRSEKEGMDILIFERPLELASVLTVTLDATKYGKKGSIRLLVPKSHYRP